MELYPDVVGKRRIFLLYLFIVCLLRFYSTYGIKSNSPHSPPAWLSLGPGLFSPAFLLFLTRIFKFRKGELKTVFWGDKALCFHNCMFSIFNAIFGHHKIFVWFCWHVLFDHWSRGGRSFQWAIHFDAEVFPEQGVNLEVNNVWQFILFLYGPKRLQ